VKGVHMTPIAVLYETSQFLVFSCNCYEAGNDPVAMDCKGGAEGAKGKVHKWL